MNTEIILIGKKEYQELNRKIDNLQSTLTATELKKEPDYITTKDFKEMFGISHVTQWKLRKAGKLPYMTIGKSIIYSLAEIEKVTKQ
ncbi:MAG TPA: helix-turn-helix domain-containing protein [Bacteroidales bacterium]|nr:helix-turn-helix domain-containing protein [Bacteroidales bacterium]HQP54176.1 helix-turn-helix domain-containing protein [Bacteroidales bacterium]